MALQPIGLAAVLEDSNFQAGLKRYVSGVGQMTSLTDHAAGVLSLLGNVASGAVVAGLGAVTTVYAGAIALTKTGLDATREWAENLDRLGDEFGLSGTQATAWTVLMNHVGLSLDEGAQGLNFFTRNLDNYKSASAGAQTTTRKSADEIAHLRQQLDDANVRLLRAQKTLAEAKHPTDAMRYAVEDAQKAVGRLNTELASATTMVPKAAAALTPFDKALATLGVSAFDSRGKLKTFDQIMPEIMDKFQKLPAGVNASALAMDLFGARGGSKFLDFLRQGSAGLKNATELAKEFGLNLSTQQVDAAEQFGFALNDLSLGLLGVRKQFGDAVLPELKDGVEYINRNVIPLLVSLAHEYAPKLAELIGKTSVVLEDLFDLLRGKGTTLAQFAADVARLAQFFGLDGTAVEKFASGLLRAIQNIYNAWKSKGLTGLFDALGQEITRAVPVILQTLGQLGGRFWDWLKTAEPHGEALVGRLVAQAAGWFRASWPTISRALAGWGAQLWDWLGGTALPVGERKVAQLAAALGQVLADNWPVLARALDQYARRFWDWLTNGVLPEVGTRLQPVAAALGAWLGDSKNFQPVADALGRWTGWFWAWLTNPEGGLLVSVSGNMVQLTEALKQWSADPKTQKSLNEIGRTIAQGVIDGIGSLFKDDKQGDNLLQALSTNIGRAYLNLKQSFDNIGLSISDGIVRALAENLGFSQAATDQIVQGFNALFTKVMAILQDPAGPFLGLVRDFINNIINFIQSTLAAALPSLLPTPPAAGGSGFGATGAAGAAGAGAGAGFATGGWVPRDMLARVHRGEYVIPVRPAPTVNQGGPLQIVNNWPDSIAQMDRHAFEQLAEGAAYKALTRVLQGA